MHAAHTSRGGGSYDLVSSRHHQHHHHQSQAIDADWKDDLPPAVAAAYDKLVRTSERLPQAPHRTSLGNQRNAIDNSTRDNDLLLSASSKKKQVADASCGPPPRNASVQCDTVTIELNAARDRLVDLERRLVSTMVVQHIGGLDRLLAEEGLERRDIESHHSSLLLFISSSWERVRISMHQTMEANRRANEALAAVEASRHEAERLSQQVESLQRVNRGMKEMMGSHTKIMDECAALRGELQEEVAKRAAAELQLRRVAEDRKRYKGRAKELEQAVVGMRRDVDGLTSRHQDIVGELERSLRVLVVGDASALQAMDTTTTTQQVLSSSSSMIAATASSSSSPTAERRRLELQFQLQDTVRELDEAKATIRTLRATISTDTLNKQALERQAEQQREILQREARALKADSLRYRSEIETLQRELHELRNTAKELGRCRGQLALSEKRLAEATCSQASNNSSVRSNQIRQPQKQAVPHTDADAMQYVGAAANADDSNASNSTDDAPPTGGAMKLEDALRLQRQIVSRLAVQSQTNTTTATKPQTRGTTGDWTNNKDASISSVDMADESSS